MKATVGASLAAAATSYLLTKRRSYLSLRMNILGAFLDISPLFPQTPFPEDRKEHEALVVAKRAEWEQVTSAMETLYAKKAVAVAEDVFAPSRSAGRGIRCRLYKPLKSDFGEELPVIMEMHGGGWTFGTIEVYDSFCRTLAENTHCIVCSVEYRLAPEHPFPAGLEDCEDVLKWIVSEPKEIKKLGGSPLKRGLALSGDSAGGNLASVLAVLASTELNIQVDLQVLIYPVTCAFGLPLWREAPYVHLSSDSMMANSDAPILTLKALTFLWNSYLARVPPQHAGHEERARILAQTALDPRVSPVLFSLDKLKQAPPAYVITGDADVLKDEGVAYTEKLRKAGVKVEHRNYPDAIHAFISLPQCTSHHEGNDHMGRFIKDFFTKKNNSKL